MNKHALPTFTMLLVMCSAQAQIAPEIQWQKCLGGSFKDFGNAIQQNSNVVKAVGYVVVGGAGSMDGQVSGGPGGGDAWVVQLDNVGNIIWQKPLGGSAYDHAYAVRQTTDGGYVVAGETNSNDGDVTGSHGGVDAWVVKLDAMGNISWQKALGGSDYDPAYAVRQTTEGGYIVAGSTLSNDGDVSGNHGNWDVWIVKLDDMGNILWQRALGGSQLDEAKAIQQTTDGGYVVAGLTQSNDGDVSGQHGSVDAWVVKLDDSGSITWQKPLGGSNVDWAHAVQQTTDGGYVVAGASNSNDGDVSGNHGDYDAWCVKLDAMGNITWQKALGGSDRDRAYAVQQTTDGGYVVAGEAHSNDGDVSGNHGAPDLWAVKLDAMGNLSWQKAMGGTDGENANAVQQTTDGGYILAGTTGGSNDGDVFGNHGFADLWVVKLDNQGVGLEEPAMTSFQVAPNPSAGLVSIRTNGLWKSAQLTLTDALGQEVLRENMTGSSATLELTAWPRGLYLMAIRSGERTSSQRLVLE